MSLNSLLALPGERAGEPGSGFSKVRHATSYISNDLFLLSSKPVEGGAPAVPNSEKWTIFSFAYSFTYRTHPFRVKHCWHHQESIRRNPTSPYHKKKGQSYQEGKIVGINRTTSIYNSSSYTPAIRTALFHQLLRHCFIRDRYQK